MSDDTDLYLIWSHEHRGWWPQDRCGYPRRLSLAGRFTREEALRICADGMAGTTARLGGFPELPVREADVKAMISRYPFAFGLESAL